MARAIKIMMVGFLLVHALIYAQEPLVIDDDRLIIEDILIQGNRITKESILLRELVFGIGDTILKMELLPHSREAKKTC